MLQWLHGKKQQHTTNVIKGLYSEKLGAILGHPSSFSCIQRGMLVSQELTTPGSITLNIANLLINPDASRPTISPHKSFSFPF